MEPADTSTIQQRTRVGDPVAPVPTSARSASRSEPRRAPSKLESFLRDVSAACSLSAPLDAEDAAALTVWVLGQRLGGGATKRLLAALPPSVRGLFEAFQAHTGGPPELFDGREFSDRLAALLGVGHVRAEVVCRGVFRALRAHLPASEVDHVAGRLPGELRCAWLSFVPGERLPSGLVPMTGSLAQLAGEIEAAGPLPGGVVAVRASITVLCALADVLAEPLLENLAGAMPAELRPMWSKTGPQLVGGSDWAPTVLHTVAVLLGLDEQRAAVVVRRVFVAVQRTLPGWYVDQLASGLPDDVRELWHVAHQAA